MSDPSEERNRRVEEFVRGQADDDTARQMEIEMLEDDDLFERIQTEDLLKRGFEENERSASSDGDSRREKAAFLPRLGWALAATFAAVAISLGIYSVRLDKQVESLRSPSVGIPIATVIKQRSPLAPSGESQLNLAQYQGPVLLEFDVSGLAHNHFKVEVVGESETIGWHKQRPDERGYLTVMIPDGSSVVAIRVIAPNDEIIHSYTSREDSGNE